MFSFQSCLIPPFCDDFQICYVSSCFFSVIFCHVSFFLVLFCLLSFYKLFYSQIYCFFSWVTHCYQPPQHIFILLLLLCLSICLVSRLILISQSLSPVVSASVFLVLTLIYQSLVTCSLNMCFILTLVCQSLPLVISLSVPISLILICQSLSLAFLVSYFSQCHIYLSVSHFSMSLCHW